MQVQINLTEDNETIPFMCMEAAIEAIRHWQKSGKKDNASRKWTTTAIRGHRIHTSVKLVDSVVIVDAYSLKEAG